MKSTAIGALAACLVLVSAEEGLAQASSAQRAACTPDVFRLCSGDIPNVSKITACLRRERPRLSGACGEIFDSLDRGATRSLAAGPARPGGWCEFGANPTPGQDVWIAWCEDGGR